MNCFVIMSTSSCWIRFKASGNDDNFCGCSTLVTKCTFLRGCWPWAGIEARIGFSMKNNVDSYAQITISSKFSFGGKLIVFTQSKQN